MKNPITPIAIACQGGGSHCAYTSGVLAALMRQTECVEGRLLIDGRYELVGLSGTSGGAISAYLAWVDLLRMREAGYRRPESYAVERFWEGMKAQPFPWPPSFPSPDLYSNWLQLTLSLFDGVVPMVSASPNAITGLAQQHLRESIDAAAGLSDRERHLAGPPLPRKYLASAGPGDFPMLMIGAANIDDSDFAPFLSTPLHRPRTEQLLASAALPDVFPAVTVAAEASPVAEQKRAAARQMQSTAALPPSAPARYWDGLLSQNPPLGEFLAVPLESRPAEIWIVRINPALQVREIDRQRPQMLASEVRDRRNELAGNLSLEQEKRFIRKINALVRRYPALADDHRVVQTWGIALDGPWDMPEDAAHQNGRWRPAMLPLPKQLQDLDATSKLKRFAPFIEALSEHGRACCEAFLAARRKAPPATGRTDPLAALLQS